MAQHGSAQVCWRPMGLGKAASVLLSLVALSASSTYQPNAAEFGACPALRTPDLAAGGYANSTAPRGTCHKGKNIIVEQRGPRQLNSCLFVAAHLIVELQSSVVEGPRWAGPPDATSHSVLLTTFRGRFGGVFAGEFVARKRGIPSVISESNAACRFLTSAPPCSLPVFVTTLVVSIINTPQSADR
jgi:hypothetical protein